MNSKISPNIRIGNPNIKGNDYLLISNSLGSLFDHGKRSLISFLFILLITYVRYSSLLSPLALAVCTIENNLPVVVAPSAVLQNKNDFLAMTNGLTTLSARLLDISR